MENANRSLDLAVAHLAAAVEAGDPASAAVALGRDRGEHGIALGQSLDDLEVVHRIVTSSDPPPPIVRAFADAWAEAAVTILLDRGALDHRTGLATTAFLTTRLRDLARTGEHTGRKLIVVRCVDWTVGRFAALLRSTRIASELARSFPGAETPVGIGDWRIAAIVPNDDVHDAHLARARQSIARIDGVRLGGVVALELPTEEDDVPRYVAEL